MNNQYNSYQTNPYNTNMYYQYPQTLYANMPTQH